MASAQKKLRAKYQAAFENFLDACCTKRDPGSLQKMVTAGFTGFGTGGDEDYCNADEGLAIFGRHSVQAFNRSCSTRSRIA